MASLIGLGLCYGHAFLFRVHLGSLERHRINALALFRLDIQKRMTGDTVLVVHDVDAALRSDVLERFKRLFII